MISLIATRGSRSRCARKSGHLTEQITRAEEIQGQAGSVRCAGFDPNLAAPDAVQGIASVAFLEQHLAFRELLGTAKT